LIWLNFLVENGQYKQQRKEPSMYPNVYRRPMLPQPRPSGYGVGYLLIIILSAFLVLSGAKGFITLTGLSYLVGVLLVAILCMTKMYFLRYQPIIERTVNSGWDRVVGYAATAFFLVALAAFGLYCVSSDGIADSGVVKSTLAAPQSTLSLDAPVDGSGIVVGAEKNGKGKLRKTSSESLRLSLLDQKESAANTAPPQPAEIQKTTGSVGSVRAFVNDTFSQRNAALGCWIITMIVEISILILVLHNRPRYLPYHYME
jgi:amino acid transporter